MTTGMTSKHQEEGTEPGGCTNSSPNSEECHGKVFEPILRPPITTKCSEDGVEISMGTFNGVGVWSVRRRVGDGNPAGRAKFLDESGHKVSATVRVDA